MKKLKIVLVLISFFALSGFKDASNDKANKDQEIKATTVRNSTDITSPVISFKQEEDIVLKEGSELELSNFIDVTDEETGVKAVTSFGKFNSEQAGTYNISVVAIDNASNVASLDVIIKVITNEEFEELEASKAQEAQALINQKRQAEREKARAILEANFQDGNTDIASLAEAYIGMGGYCNEVAQSFLTDYYGHNINIYDSYNVSYEDAKPGDLVEYADGGKGTWHVAVYLGNGMALHGNWNGTTVISSIWVDGATTPYFQRVN